MCYIQILPATQKLKEIKSKLISINDEIADLNKRKDKLIKQYDNELQLNCQKVITACSSKCQVPNKKKKTKFKCVTEPERCDKQCSDCKYAVRCMKVGRFQNIFPHKTNNANKK